MEDFNIIYDPNTMKKHSLYSNYGRNLLKQMLSSYKSGGVASFHTNVPPLVSEGQGGNGYSLDPSLPRIGGLGEIVEVDTCPDNQDGGDYFLDPSRPAIAGRTEVVGYKPCNHEPPTPVVADATNEVPQELQDGGMNLVRGAVDGIKKIGSNVVGTLKNVVERISGSESEDEDMDEYWGEEMVEIPTATVEDDPAILRELAQLEADGMKILTADNL